MSLLASIILDLEVLFTLQIDRFVLDDFRIWTAKIELRNPNFVLRWYTTRENAGDSYAANTLASLINQQKYLPFYFEIFLQARTLGQTVEEAHASARSFADEKSSSTRNTRV